MSLITPTLSTSVVILASGMPCHGPGSRHVAWAETVERGESAPEDPGSGLVVRLRDLDDPYWSYDERGIARRNPRRRRAGHSRRDVSGALSVLLP